MIMKKTVYYAVYGNNQVPFKSLKTMKAYFSEGGNLFDAIMGDVKFFKLVITQIDSPLNS